MIRGGGHRHDRGAGTHGWLRASEARLREVLDNVVDGIITVRQDGTIESFNPAAERIFGYPADEVVGRNVSLLMPEPERSEHDRYMRRYLRTGQASVIGIGRETEGLHKDGNRIPIHLGVSEVVLDGERIFTGIVRDITEVRRRRDELRTSEQRTRSIIDNMLDGLITFTEDGMVESLNPAAERMFGYRSDELEGVPLGRLIADWRKGSSGGFAAQLVAAALDRVTEWEAVAADGRRFPVELSLFEFSSPGGRRFAGNVRDLSGLREVERLKRELVSTVSHELRTPLTSIRGSLGLLEGGVAGELAGEASRLVGIALKNCERLIFLINDLLDLEKIEAGKLDFERRPLDLVACVRQAIEDNAAYAHTLGVGLELVEAPARLQVVGDGDRLGQVLANLLSNAAKASPAGGAVEVTVSRVGGMARVSVRDRGPGIAPELRDRVFERYVQAGDRGRRDQGGSGLGLSISRAIITRMDGRIDFECPPAGGTVFFFELPILERDSTP